MSEDADSAAAPEEPAVSRRTLLRTGAAAGGATVTGAAGVELGAIEEVEGAAVTTALVLGGIVLASGGIAGYMIGRSHSSVDRSAEQGEADYDNWVEVYNAAREIQTVDSTAMESFQRDVNTATNAARREAIFTIYEQAKSGSTKSTATDQAKAAVDEVFANIEQGIWNHYSARVTKLESELSFLDSSNFSTAQNEVLAVWEGNTQSLYQIQGSHSTGGGASWDLRGLSFSMHDVTLPDGSTVSVPTRFSFANNALTLLSSVPEEEISPGAGTHRLDHFLPDYGNMVDEQAYAYLHQPTVREPDPSLFDSVDADTSNFDGTQTFVDFVGFLAMVQDLRSQHQTALDQVDLLVDTHYQPAKDGEIDLSQMVGTTGMIEKARNASNFREAALAMRVFGFPKSDTAVRLEFELPSGERATTDAYLFWTTPDGNTLPVGQSVDPSSIPGTFYAAFNQEDSEGITGSIGEITSPFTITKTESGATSVGFVDRGTVTTSMSPSEARDEFLESGRAVEDAENERQHINTEGGSGIGLPTIGGFDPSQWLPVAAIIAGIGLLWGGGS